MEALFERWGRFAARWGHPTKTPSDLREAPVRRGERRQGAFAVSGDSQRQSSLRWAIRHDACVDCGTTQRPHRAGGRCKRCDDRWRYRQLR